MKPYLTKLMMGVVFCYAVFFSSAGLAQTQDLSKYKLGKDGFVENKGQISDQNHMPNSDVKYLLNCPGFNVQLRQTGFSYDTYTEAPDNGAVQQEDVNPKGIKHPQPLNRYYHRVDIELLGANPQAQLVTEGKSHVHYNYLTGDAQHKVNDVHYYSKVVYKDIYPHIDLEFFISNKTHTDIPVEYQFVVHAGGNPANIKLAYKGANNVSLNAGKIVVSVAAGDFTENIPASYFKANGQNVNVNYKALGNNTFTFSLPNTTTIASDLVIDPKPNLDWGTYYGGSGDDEAYSIAVDAAGDAYITGTSSSSSDIATAGAYQTTYAGDYDVLVAEISSDGSTLDWGTYYGGSGNEYGNGIVLDESDNVYITGATSSSSGISTTGAYQTSLAGGTDAFVAEISSDGSTLVWGTYFGGSGTDYGAGLALDGSDNVYIAGYSTSSSGVATTGAYQTTLSGGTDAFVAEISSDGSTRDWGTYYGGSGTDYAWGIALDASADSYITGQTTSTSSIATTGTYQTTNGGGGTDAFVAEISSDGSALNAGTFYGGRGYDVGYGIALDGDGNAYITGQTESNNIGLSAGAFDTAYGSQGRTTFGEVLLAEFSSNLTTLKYGTYYGRGNCVLGGGPPPIPPDFYGYAIALDGIGNIYITGEADPNQCGVTDMVTASTWKSTTGGYEYCYVAKFNPNAVDSTHQLVWGTFYGGTGIDFGYGIAVNGNNSVYVTGFTDCTGSTTATTGAYQTTFGGSYDAFVAYFDTSSGGRSTTSITPVADNGAIAVYPTIQNSNTVLNVTLPNNNTGLIDIYDLAGRKTFESLLSSGSNQLSLSSFSLSQGTYLYRIVLNDNSVKTGKLIWQQ